MNKQEVKKIIEAEIEPEFEFVEDDLVAKLECLRNILSVECPSREVVDDIGQLYLSPWSEKESKIIKDKIIELVEAL